MIVSRRALLALALIAAGCDKGGGEAGPTASAEATASPTATALATSRPAMTARATATATSTAAPTGAPAAEPGGLALECRVKDGARTVELWLAWDKNMAKGELRTLKGGKAPEVQPVVAENYKELVLVDKPGSKNIKDTLAQGKQDLATGKLSALRLGSDSGKPHLPCEAGASDAAGGDCASACKQLMACKMGPFEKPSDCELACRSAEDDPVTLAAWGCRMRASDCAAMKRCDK